MRFWVCLVIYAVAMLGVWRLAHAIVDTFGPFAMFALIGLAYGTARYFERRSARIPCVDEQCRHH
jgi:hypothetical protein